MAIKPRKYQTRKGPRWLARWTKPDGSQGTLGGFRTEREAKSYASKQEAGVLEDPTAGKTRVEAFWALWRATQGHLKPKTLAGYDGLWRTKLGPQWGRRPLSSIRPMEVQAWTHGLLEQGYSHSMIRQVHGLLSQVLESAVENGYLSKSPVQKLRLSKSEGGVTKEALHERALNLSQLAALVKVAEDEGYGHLVLFMASSGLRFGEVRGLRRVYCHLKDALPFPHVEVVWNVTDVEGKPSGGTPKNHQRRTVYLPPSVASLMLPRLPEDPDALAFTSPKGLMLDPNNFRNGPFQRWKKKAGLPENLRPHDLRHTCGSLMANSGVPLVQVRDHLGHSTLAVTEGYVHPRPFSEQPPVGSLKEWLEVDLFQECWPKPAEKGESHGLG